MSNLLSSFQDIEELQKYISQSCGSGSGIHDNKDNHDNSNDGNHKCTMALGDIPSVDLATPTTETDISETAQQTKTHTNQMKVKIV